MNIIDLIPYGKENAISREDLSSASGLKDRDMRDTLEGERPDYSILNMQDGKGYFRPLPSETHLAQKWLAGCLKRIRSLQRSAQGTVKFLNEQHGQDFILVRSYTRRRRVYAEQENQIDGQMRL